MTLQFLALVFGPFYVAIFLPGMLYPREMQKIIKNLLKDATLVRVLGGIIFLLGMVIINVEYRIFKDWEALIVILGYLSILKGLVYMWWPNSVKKIFSKYSVQGLGLASAAGFVIGAALCYLGAYIY